MSTTDTVHSWFRERVATGVIARDTDAYNQAAAALPDLIARLDAPASVEAPVALVEAPVAPVADPETPAHAHDAA